MASTKIDWNLLKTWAEHLAKVKEEDFDMSVYRSGPNPYLEIQCDSPGCVIGHMVRFATKPVPRIDGNIIYFDGFAETELGINRRMPLWNYLFASEWKAHDNTIEGAINRINFAWADQTDPSSKYWNQLCPWYKEDER